MLEMILKAMLWITALRNDESIPKLNGKLVGWQFFCS